MPWKNRNIKACKMTRKEGNDSSNINYTAVVMMEVMLAVVTIVMKV
jgi:hypothetical protein